MKIENPETGQQLEINPPSAYRVPNEGDLHIPRALDRVADEVLRMDDLPDGVPAEQWKSYLATTFRAVEGQHALQAPLNAYGVQRNAAWRAQRQIEDAIEQGKANKVWDTVDGLLQGTGLRVERKHVAQGGSIRYHQVFRGDQDVGNVGIPWGASAQQIARLVKEAAGL